MRKIRMIAVLVGIFAVALALGIWIGKMIPDKVDPHEGEIYADDGKGEAWISGWTGATPSSLQQEDFVMQDGVLTYTGEEYEVRRGIDISGFQNDIDWQKVHDSGIDFAFIRAGFRGYGKEGKLVEDDTFRDNLKGATEAGLDVGVYFYSQAITVEEAVEEAEYVLELLDGEPLQLPVFFDWEANSASGSRTSGTNKVYLSEAGLQFCKTIEDAGYEAGIYFYRQLGYYVYDLGEYAPYSLWLSEPGTYPSFYYAVDFWQYSFEGEVPGIDIITDLNLQFIRKSAN